MFDLDKAIYGYLGQLGDKSLVSRDCLDEVENHLREQIECYLSEGMTEEAAFQKAIVEMGSPSELLREFGFLYEGKRRDRFANILSHYFDRRVVMRLLMGFFFGAFFLLTGLYLEGGTIHDKVQPTAFMIVFGGAFGALLITYPITIVRNSLLLAVTGRQATRPLYLDASNVFKSFGDMAVLSSFIGVIFGVIHVLQHLSALDRIGAGCAVALVSILYGVLLKLFIGKALSDSFKARAYPSAEVIKSGNGGEHVKP